MTTQTEAMKLALEALEDYEYGKETMAYLAKVERATAALRQALEQQPAQPMTDDELADLWYKQSLDWMEFARAIEAAHGIKEKT